MLAGTALAEKATSCEVHREFGSSDHGPVQAIFDLPPAEVLPPEEPEPEDPKAGAPGPGAPRVQLPLKL